MPNRWFRFRWPANFKGDPVALGELAGLFVRRDGDAFKATTIDAYNRSWPRLVRLVHVVGEQTRRQETWRHLLERWTGAADPAERLPGRVDAEIRRLLHEGEETDPTIEEYVQAARLRFLCLPDDHFCNWMGGELLPTFGEALPDHRLCLVSYSDQIHQRMAFIRALFTADHAPEWATGADPSLSAVSGLAGEGFHGGTPFVDALLGSHSPWMFGISLPRIRSGFAVALFGNVLAGRPGMVDPSLVDMLTTRHLTGDVPVRAPATPSIATDAAEAAVRWWVNGLNRLMAHVLDPTLFTDDDGWYLSHQHYGHVMTVERLFASVVSLLVHSGRDEYTRRTHLFEALDLLEGLSLGGYDQTLSLKLLRAQLGQIEQALPAGVGEVVLSRCEGALDGLVAFRDDFHPSRVVDDETISVLNKDGSAGTMGKDKAASGYLRRLRNAGHGLGEELENARFRSLLVAHEGDVPAAVSDIAFLHLVRLIANPDLILPAVVRHQLARRASAGA